MARGLPPNPPSFPVLGTPAGMRRAAPSAAPPITLTGRLEVRNLDGIVIGYVRNLANPGQTISGIIPAGLPGVDGLELHVSLTTTPSGQGPFEIVATNALFPGPALVGAGGDAVSNNPVLNPNSPSYIGFRNVFHTPPNSKPVESPTTGMFLESSIWSIDLSDNQLTPQWINPDGSKPETFLIYGIARFNTLGFVSNITAFNDHNLTPASEVQLFLVPI